MNTIKRLVIAICITGLLVHPRHVQATPPHARHAPGSRHLSEASLPSIIVKISKSVVVISGRGDSGGRALGTGFYIHSGGYIITALHVVSGGNIRVGIPHAGYYHSIPGTLVAQDKSTDLAIVKVVGDLPPLDVELSPVASGDQVAILGFPYGPKIDQLLVPCASAGIISAVRPSPDGISAHISIQLDMTVEHGNSGGPLFKQSTGAVVGVVITRLVPDGSEETTVRAGLASSAQAIHDLLMTVISKGSK